MKMANLQVQAPPVNFSNHNKSYSYTSTCNMGKLIPVMWQRVMPNDRVKISNEIFLRFSPLVYPMLSEVNVKLFTFYCPTIALWNRWKKFMSEKPLNDEPDKPFFRINALYDWQPKYYQPSSLADYLGLPMQQFFSGARDNAGLYIQDGHEQLDAVDESIDPSLFLVYQKIWNRYFRDENLTPDIFDEDCTETSFGDTIDPDLNLYNRVIDNRGRTDIFYGDLKVLKDLFELRTKAWEKDLFTSSLPSPQFGDPVPVPVETSLEYQPSGFDGQTIFANSTTGSPIPNGDVSGVRIGNDHNLILTVTYNDDVGIPQTRDFSVDINNVGNIKAVGGNFTINDLRMASAVQRYQESLMRAGHRYEEQMRYQFDQVVPNASLREPELLSATTSPVQFNEISQTSETAATALGSQAGQAFSYNNGRKSEFSFHAPDHGYIMSIMCIVPRTSYMNGLDKEFQMFSRLDYFNPIFETVGDEPLFNKEVYLSSNPEYNEREFGYIPRFAREKVSLNRTTGQMTNNLLRMNLGRAFGTRPLLNQSFIEVDDATVNRGFAITDPNLVDNVWFFCKNHIFMRRPMQYNPIPKLI